MIVSHPAAILGLSTIGGNRMSECIADQEAQGLWACECRECRDLQRFARLGWEPFKVRNSDRPVFNRQTGEVIR